MNVIGIVCEYNPFHNGHKYQIDKIKEMYKDSIIIACMSSSFTQRGEVSILNKYDKTSIALNNGIDIVIELPYIFSVQSADTFAMGSIGLLNEFKIDTLVFGTEKDNIKSIEDCAKVQLTNKEYDKLVKKYMDEGNNYPTSLNNALKDLNCDIIKDPNDLLALSYIKEIIKNKYNINYINIKRTNSFHDIDSNDTVVSSSNIRNSLLEGKSIKHQVPNMTYEYLSNKKINTNKYFELLKYKIISEEDLSKYLDVDEGIDIRIKSVINKSNSLDELIQNIKTKRYTYNKISRMLNHILCSFTKKDNIKKLEYIRVLGFNSRGQQYLNMIKKDINLPILNSYDSKYKCLDIEKRVSSIYSLVMEDITEYDKMNKPIKIE